MDSGLVYWALGAVDTRIGYSILIYKGVIHQHRKTLAKALDLLR